MASISNHHQHPETHKSHFLEYNMSLPDVILRYVILMLIVIIGGALHSIPIMLLGLPFFWSAILGWCPIFWMLGINKHKD